MADTDRATTPGAAADQAAASPEGAASSEGPAAASSEGPAAASSEGPAAALPREAIRLAETAADRDEAIRRCGEVLVETGAARAAYIDAMLARELSISTYVGEGVAIPHGTLAGKDDVRHDALAVLRFPEGVDWGGETVTVCVAIAAKGNGHVALLSELAQILLDPDQARALREATDPDDVLRLLAPMHAGTTERDSTA